MIRQKRFFAVIILGIFAIGMANIPDAWAKKKRVLRDPDAPTNKEAKVLGWGPVKTPNRAKNPEFMIRGVAEGTERIRTSDITAV